ncbi:MAG: SDR family oxidoreductase [Phycisphaerales bacterium]
MQTNRPLENRIAVITGASAGIGRAAALTLAHAGAAVVVNARRAERLDELVTEITQARGRATAVPGDAAESAVIARTLDAAKATFGADADLVIVNAGRGLSGSPTTSDEAQWEEMVRLNLIGAARLVRAAAERMVKIVPEPRAGANTPASDPWLTRPRDIVLLGSTVGKHISPFSSMYGSTKFALNSIAEAVRRELAPKGIRVSSISPAIVRSEFQGVAGYDPAKFGAFMDSVGPVLEPDDIARLILFMVSQPASVCINDVVIRPTRQEYP